MPAPFTSIFKTNNFYTDVAKKSFAGKIAEYFPAGNAPLFALTSMMASETAVDTTHGYHTRSMVFPILKLNGAVANGTDQTFTVDDSSQAIPGMLFRASTTMEQVRISSVPNGTSVVVTRGFGSISGAAIADDVELHLVGTAWQEGSGRPTPYSLDIVFVSNYTQIFRNAWAVTGSAAAVQVIVGKKPEADNRMQCADFHSRDIESQLLFGQKKNTTTDGVPIRAAEGLYHCLLNNASNNIVTAGSTTNYTQLETGLDKCFDTAMNGNNSSERLLFVGGGAWKVINAIGRLNGTYQLVQGQTEYGLQFNSFKISRGTFAMVEHPLMNAYGPTSPFYKMAIAVHIPSFSIAYLGNRKTISEEYNINGRTVEGGVDAIGGSLLTEATFQFQNPAANAVFQGLTAGAAG